MQSWKVKFCQLQGKNKPSLCTVSFLLIMSKFEVLDLRIKRMQRQNTPEGEQGNQSQMATSGHVCGWLFLDIIVDLYNSSFMSSVHQET